MSLDVIKEIKGMKNYYKELILPIIFIIISIIGLIMNVDIEIIKYSLDESGIETKLFFISLIIVSITIIIEIIYQEKQKEKE